MYFQFKSKAQDIFILACIVLGVLSLPVECQAVNLQNSVVKVFVTSNPIDFSQPWQTYGTQGSSGSGCIIEGNRILTNAHVVDSQTFIQVRKQSSPKKYTAQVLAIGYDCDLALLVVEDETFFSNLTPVTFGEMPHLQDAVTVVGFPRGGDKVSITEGVVSRIEVIPYAQSAKQLLAVQIDAAINPGNSGGPVFLDGKVVGVAMQLISNSQNIGFMIPMPIIDHFLKDLEDGVYDGFSLLGVEYHNTENSALRKYYRIPDSVEGGVIITKVLPFASADGFLKAGDVLLDVEDVAIGMDGSIPFRDEEKISFAYLVNNKQVDEKISMHVWRDGKNARIDVPVKRFMNIVPGPNRIDKPSYFIYGGLVFTTLTTDLLQTWGKNWWERAPFDFLAYLIGKGRFNPDRKDQIVVLLDILPDDINVGYGGFRHAVIKKVNGQEFSTFNEFVTKILAVKEPFIVFSTDEGLNIILETKDILQRTDAILTRNSIVYGASEDVRALIK